MTNNLDRDRVLKYIYVFIRGNHRPPSYRDIGRGTGISSTSMVGRHLDQLEAYGFITRIPGISRSIVITEAGKQKAQQLLQQEQIQ